MIGQPAVGKPEQANTEASALHCQWQEQLALRTGDVDQARFGAPVLPDGAKPGVCPRVRLEQVRLARRFQPVPVTGAGRQRAVNRQTDIACLQRLSPGDAAFLQT